MICLWVDKMEQFPQNQENKSEQKKVGDILNNFLANTSMVSGAALMLVGVFEVISKEKIGTLLHEYSSSLPDIIKASIEKLDKIPDYFKIMGGGSFVNFGYWHKEWTKNKDDIDVSDEEV